MDLLKLAGFAALLFLLLEAIGSQIEKLKPWVKRLITFFVMGAACIGLGIASPFVTAGKAQWIVNAAGYFAAEYFIFLFLRNELKVSAKDFFLKVFGGQTPPAGGGNGGK